MDFAEIYIRIILCALLLKKIKDSFCLYFIASLSYLEVFILLFFGLLSDIKRYLLS